MTDTEKVFDGFPSGSLRTTPVPDLFFSSVLPRIDSLNEVKVILHILWLLHRHRGMFRCVTLRQLLGDQVLLRGLGHADIAPEDTLRKALVSAARRGVLLTLTLEIGDRTHELYFVNTAQSRQTILKLRSAEIDVGQVVTDEVGTGPAMPDRPAIYELYEQNFGPLTPLLVEDLSEAEELYPFSWLTDAMREALRYNKRHWGYVRRVLERWAREGRGYEESRGGNHSVSETSGHQRWPRSRSR